MLQDLIQTNVLEQNFLNSHELNNGLLLRIYFKSLTGLPHCPKFPKSPKFSQIWIFVLICPKMD